MSDLVTNEKYIIPIDRFNNSLFIEHRIANTPVSVRNKLRSLLQYLYWDNGPVNLPNKNFKVVEIYLDEAEILLARWLKTRTNGSLRSSYGKEALTQARSAKYRCEVCGYSDIRALNIDHVEGKVENTSFACLCANCHTIKSRKNDWGGTKKNKQTQT